MSNSNRAFWAKTLVSVGVTAASLFSLAATPAIAEVENELVVAVPFGPKKQHS